VGKNTLNPDKVIGREFSDSAQTEACGHLRRRGYPRKLFTAPGTLARTVELGKFPPVSHLVLSWRALKRAGREGFIKGLSSMAPVWLAAFAKPNH